MKELEDIKPDKELIIPAEQRTEAFKGSKLLPRGHSVWQYKDGEVSQAEYEKSEVIIDAKGKPHKRHKLIMEEGCYYINALNYANAVKKFRKSGLRVLG